jgi:hypothetical protein
MKYSFLKLTPFSKGNNVLHFKLAESAHLEHNERFPTLKTLVCRKYSFQKLPQLTQGINGVYAVDSNLDSLTWRDTCVSSTLLNRPI